MLILESVDNGLIKFMHLTKTWDKSFAKIDLFSFKSLKILRW